MVTGLALFAEVQYNVMRGRRESSEGGDAERVSVFARAMQKGDVADGAALSPESE